MWYGRGWINSVFLLSLISVAVTFFLLADKPELRLSVCSAAIALAAMWLNFFPRFIQGPSLTAQINQITILSVPEASRSSSITSIAIRDLLSANPSATARRVFLGGGVAGVPQIVERRDENALLQFFSQTHPTRYDYLPEDDLIREFLEDRQCTPPFFIPLAIHNSGARTGHIASVVMTLQLREAAKKDNAARSWAYGAYHEVDPRAIADPRRQRVDIDVISCLFSGCSVPSGTTTRIDLYFTPHHAAGGKIISTSNFPPGDYVLRVDAYNEKGRRVFQSKVDYSLNLSTLLACFKNGQWTYYPGMDRNIWASLDD